MHFSFPFESEPAAFICREFLERDMASARMSPAQRWYYVLRPLVPLWLRHLLQRRRGGALRVSADWYIPREFCHRLATVLQTGEDDVMFRWPNERQFAFVLTHDVETADGMRLVEAVARVEEEYGFRSSWNIVPYKYSIDVGLLDDLRARGFEIGIHGYNHDGRLFSSHATFRRRAVAINAAIARYEAVGFRAPMVHRNLSWMQQLDIQYDSSCFDIDPFQAMPGGIGCMWPVVSGRFVELPYTLPQDHTLWIMLAETSDRIWRDKLSWIKRWNGMALMLTHPDYLDSPRTLDIYRRFLAFVRDAGNYWHVLPRDLAQWWRQRHTNATRVPLLAIETTP